jgi:hypothetical protein
MVTNYTGKPLTKPFSHFEIEKNENAKKFVKIGEKQSNEFNDYEFIDENPKTIKQKQLYYRLKMVDIDGLFNNSKIIYFENNLFSPQLRAGEANLSKIQAQFFSKFKIIRILRPSQLLICRVKFLKKYPIKQIINMI